MKKKNVIFFLYNYTSLAKTVAQKSKSVKKTSKNEQTNLHLSQHTSPGFPLFSPSMFPE